MACMFLLVAAALLHGQVLANHCTSSGYQDCMICIGDSRCKYCSSTSSCVMGYTDCDNEISGTSSHSACPDTGESESGEGEPFFADKTDMLADNGAQYNYGVAVTDFDRDGKFEAFVAGYNAPNKIMKWDSTNSIYVDIAGSSASVVTDASRKEMFVELRAPGRDQESLLIDSGLWRGPGKPISGSQAQGPGKPNSLTRALAGGGKPAR
ncbi:hypothetical protein CYMTET_13385 [Cymbomonas tetramitiformis]|uniref:Uncharacterized protein n=1 Tax=Cymbomonas tetramitiformis TaxID=36881 RepID=A0AAE0GJS3_9CHLO|nr:hypothetical protein CYMTET_13385 [Cymbomonas tetramitiformis]